MLCNSNAILGNVNASIVSCVRCLDLILLVVD